MSVDAVVHLVGRLLTEPDYRELFFGDRGRALEGYDLTHAEAGDLARVTRDAVEGVDRELRARAAWTRLLREPAPATGARRAAARLLDDLFDFEV